MRSEFRLFVIENSQTPSTSKVWPSDHREDDRSCAWPFFSLVQIFPIALHSDPRPFWLLVGIPLVLGPQLAFLKRFSCAAVNEPDTENKRPRYLHDFTHSKSLLSRVLSYLSVYHPIETTTFVLFAFTLRHKYCNIPAIYLVSIGDHQQH